MAQDRQYNDEQKQYFKDRAGTKEAWYHVVPHDEEGWAVKAEGKDEPEYSTGSKSEAVKEAKRLAEDSHSMAIVHDDEGKIEEQFNYQEK
ncbi:hypothetical protein WQ57_07880 [Mesobacillus campisalis]|uniref:DUF2188 domain-containing protein n=1 Tax=Mesobacillus campisalis TaxID=1408103 RepID=A0A0M2SXT2_9BACI|nr:DUF2188 domain-containing protein [Mesobacillus campisalis]KKK38516.1 hypothetical protein WQ57_07880 [Mesobacillus campisalis]